MGIRSNRYMPFDYDKFRSKEILFVLQKNVEKNET